MNLTNTSQVAAFIDAGIVLYLVVHTWRGFASGLLYQLAALVRVAAAVILGLKLSTNAGAFIGTHVIWPEPLLNVAGFMAVFTIASIVISIVFAFTVFPAIGLIDRIPGLGLMDSITGAVLALLKAVVWLAVVLNLAVALPLSPVVRDSVLGSRFGSAIINASSAFVPQIQSLLGNQAQTALLTLTPETIGSNGDVLLHIPNQLALTTDAEAERTMFVFVNQQRQQHGLAPLRLDSQLAAVARAHSQDMFTRSYFSHNTPDGLTPFARMKTAGIQFTAAGENIAYAPNVTLADTGLIQSPEHRANILETHFTRIGIGVVNGGLFEEMFTQDFAN